MVVDLNNIVPFSEWFFGTRWYDGALINWLVVVVIVGLLAMALGWLIAAVRHGPVKATAQTGRLLYETVMDFVRMSPRRVAALAWLSIKESIRRRVVVIFAIFILLLLFAGWFLDPGSIDPARLYLSFVLTATNYLVLLLVLFLSVMSLPADIKNHTIYTIVTKPVRSSEIVLGRILGFAAVGTGLLVVMGLISYVFVQRGLSHTHELAAEDLHAVEGSSGELRGLTKNVNHHRHKVTIDAQGQGHVAMEQGHKHEVTVTKDGDKTTYQLGGPEGLFQARVPLYGKLSFRDRVGKVSDKGINVGDEWTYRSFIEGGSLAAAVWTFDGVTEDAFPSGLPVEMTLGVFRTVKGDIEKGTPGSIAVKNPATGEKVDVVTFESKEYVTDQQSIPRNLQTAEGEPRDLFRDMVDKDHNNSVEIWLTCVPPQQYFGAAQADLYLRAQNASFFLNFTKAYLGIWLQMTLVIGIGVLFSTFLSGPVALLATMGVLIGGFFNEFMYKLATGQTYGGGPLESMYRMVSQEGMTTELPPGLQRTVLLAMDQITGIWLRLIAAILPDFGQFSFAEYVASGFCISGDTALTYTCRALGFLLPLFIAAYICLKTREVAK
jgi:hypothetical protein